MNKSSYYSPINILTFLFYLLPFALLTGPFIPDLIISLIVFIFLAIVLYNNKTNYLINKFSILFFSFYTILIICSIFSVDFIFSIQNSVVYIRFGLFALATWYILDADEKVLKNFFYCLIIAFLIALSSGYVQHFFGSNFFGIPQAESVRLTLPFNDRQILGGYLSRLFPLVFALAITVINPNKKYLYYTFILVLLVLTDVLVYITGERTALGLMLISSITIIFLIKQFKLLRIFSLMLSFLIIIYFSYSDDEIKKRNIDTTLSQVGINLDDSSIGRINYFSPKHESMVLTSWNIFKSHPLIGSGPHTFRILCDKDDYKANDLSCSTHPHNIYFQLLAETGILGISFLLIAFSYVALNLLGILRALLLKREVLVSDYQICLITCFALSLWPLLPTLSFFNNWINIIYYLPIGFFLHSLNSKHN